MHRLPRSVLDELCAGRGGVGGVEHLRSAQRSKTLMLVRTLVLLLHETEHPDRAAVEAAYRVLMRMPPDDGAAALCHPPVAAWAFGTASLLRRGDRSATYPGLLAAVAVAAAVRSGSEADLDVPLAPSAPGRLDLPGLGTAVLPVHATRVRVRCVGGRAEVHCAGERIEIGDGRSADPRWLPVPRLQLAHDGLPLSLLLDTRTWRHVPGTGAGHRVGGGSTDPHRWQQRLDGAWRILVDGHRPIAEEISAALRALMPIPAPRAGTRSGTFHHAFGSVAMSMPPDSRSAAVTLAHEIQHLKLAALTDMFALVEPGPPEFHYAPWRTDPRPLDGLLHGAYAHLGVAGFWRRQRRMARTRAERHRAEVEFARWTRATDDTVRMLGTQRRLTAVGRRLVDGMAGVLDRWVREPVTPEAAAEASRLLGAHRARWERAPARTGVTQSFAGPLRCLHGGG
ncbi:HEXXH motif domain-containing protein [Micromonospora sp. NBC_00898]|uniref:HEXXH motif domain-containing protein n=1 Tax=Micromonospora sp. NBC_00898 TaxID=2975981 RepID=UPI0038665CB0|nr:HEXXH motif domain-containing protein [Micromonospora sp. NBC_00898]